MKIRTFPKFVEDEASVDHTLNNSTLVIDGQNFFYNLYLKSGLQFIFGCETEKYADYLRNYLSMFRKANVKCYFIFKGGHEDLAKRLNKSEHLEGNDFEVGMKYDDIVLPVFMKDAYKQVLYEMGFDYVICEFEAKKECIAFAQKHKCPILSYDIEFCFSGVPYIPSKTLNFINSSKKLVCKLFKFEDFLQRYKISEENLAIFIVLRDQNIFPGDDSQRNRNGFPENNFVYLLKWLKIPLGCYKCNLALLKWLSTIKREQALDTIFKFNKKDKEKFLEEEIKVKKFICRQETTGIPTQYLENGNQLDIPKKDALWFEKGVALKYIAITYVNIYRSDIVVGTWTIEDKNGDDSLLLSMQIMKYAYDLLTNFKRPEIAFYNKKTKTQTLIGGSIEKPSYEADDSVFENGWTGIRSHKLFEHFLIETLQEFHFDILEKLPEDVRLLMIALVYFSHNKSVNTSNEVYSVLLSYIALSIVSETNDTNNDITANMSKKPLLDSSRDIMNQNDKVTAAAILKEYFSVVTNQEAKVIFDPKLIHPLVEFQHILQHMNYLNKLCGSPYTPTVYSKTYNGTFVYKILYEINKYHGGDGLKFVMEKLNPAASVLAFVNGLIESYDLLMFT